MRSQRLIVLGLAVSLVAGACQTTTTPSPTPAASLAIATPAATTPPAPTDPPPDVAALFADEADRLRSGIVTFSGTATIGLVQMALTGETTYTGIDSRGKTTTTVAGEPTTVEFVQVAGKRYVKDGDGPWLEAPITTSGDLAGALQKAALGALSDAGAEERGGQTVHRLVPSAAVGFDPSVMLSSATAVSDLKVEMAFLATEDGLPVAAAVEASWTQAADGASVEATMSLDIGLRSLGRPQTVRVPEDVWTAFTSARYDVTLAYPGDFDYEKKKKYDWFASPEYGGISLERTLTGGSSLTSLAKFTVSFFKDELRNETTKNEAYAVDGIKARLVTAIGKSKDGERVVIYSLVVVKGKYVYWLDWIALSGNEAEDLATFKQVLATFDFT